MIDASAVHQIGPDQAGEGQRALNGLLSRLSQAQQQAWPSTPMDGARCIGASEAETFWLEFLRKLAELMDQAEEDVLAHMTLETIASLGDNSILSLSPRAG